MFFKSDFNYVFKKNNNDNFRLNISNKQSLNFEKKIKLISNNKNSLTLPAKMLRDAKKTRDGIELNEKILHFDLYSDAIYIELFNKSTRVKKLFQKSRLNKQ